MGLTFSLTCGFDFRMCKKCNSILTFQPSGEHIDGDKSLGGLSSQEFLLPLQKTESLNYCACDPVSDHCSQCVLEPPE